MRIETYQTLPEFASTAPMDGQSVARLRQAGVAVLDQAIDTFFKADREVQEARQAVKDLKELEGAMRACIDRSEAMRKANFDQVHNRLAAIQSGGTLEPRKEESFDPPQNGIVKRVQTAETADLRQPRRTPETPPGLAAFIRDLHEIVPLFTAAAMVPGPLSVTVKDMARELYTRQTQGGSSFSQSSQSSSLTGSLVLLGVHGSESRSSASGEESHTEEVRHEKVSTDERLLPRLFELRERMARFDQTEPTHASIVGRRSTTQYNRESYTTGFWLWKKTHTQERVASEDRNERLLEQLVWTPPQVWLPDTATQWTTAKGLLLEQNGY